jgi:hypothetical protein
VVGAQAPEGSGTILEGIEEAPSDHGRAIPGLYDRTVHGMLEYFGQTPIVVRSSRLLEDNFGISSRKIRSVFCANQGSPGNAYKSF